jgi:hypothetical protein
LIDLTSSLLPLTDFSGGASGLVDTASAGARLVVESQPATPVIRAAMASNPILANLLLAVINRLPFSVFPGWKGEEKHAEVRKWFGSVFCKTIPHGEINPVRGENAIT